MAERGELDGPLLGEITRRMKEISDTQHELARQQRILSKAATQLRTGKGGQTVLAEIREQDASLMRDYCDLQITLSPAPLRTVPRAAASA
ncbi:MAG TPA: hypothetical protein VID28_00040 [Methylomirabilota bacterium]|jgi:predicted RNA binding protein with dsRBD fold (UPF0201 family)